MPPQSDDSNAVYRGSCFCRRVTYAVTGCPLVSAYCHCTICQRLNRKYPLHPHWPDPLKAYLDSPFVHTIHFPESAFAWTHAQPHEDALQSFTIPQKPWKTRWRCRQCGGCVTSHNSKTKKRSVWGVHLERDEEGKIVGWEDLKPTAHICYGTRILDINDSLLKWDGYQDRSIQITT